MKKTRPLTITVAESDRPLLLAALAASGWPPDLLLHCALRLMSTYLLTAYPLERSTRSRTRKDSPCQDVRSLISQLASKLGSTPKPKSA